MDHQNQKSKVEFGDFQTPMWLAKKICSLLLEQGITPKSILEPTCGQGNFLVAALDNFKSVTTAIGVDINPNYIGYTKQVLSTYEKASRTQVLQGDFFNVEWTCILSELPDPLLIIGNPPWVTNSELASLNSNNLPNKSNFQNHLGIDAITGASNFDISEWMLLQMLEWVDKRQAVIAMLCKTAVARKVLLHSWRQNLTPADTRLYLIDAQRAFSASVDACLLVYDTRHQAENKACHIYSDLSTGSHLTHMGYRDGQLVANIEFYEQWKHLKKYSQTYHWWRSGIKHDCSKVMELKRTENGYINKLGEVYDLEDEYIYPMLKSSDISSAVPNTPCRWMLVTQRSVGDSTLPIKLRAPKTWAYLNEHSNFLDNRKSTIYKNRPRFSVFGVGEYSFAPWKVAVSGMYKRLNFVVIGPYAGKPTVLDDTCYFIPCQSKEESELIAYLLNSEIAQQFFQAFIFWDAKRPITAKILRQLDLFALARELDQKEAIHGFVQPTKLEHNNTKYNQLRLLEKRSPYLAAKYR
jgi:hypothetical protein